jgi:predicted dehydrogenase
MRAAVVGLGIGHAHCAGYLTSPHATLAAVCDLLPERLARVSGTFDQGSMHDLRSLYPPELLEKRWQDLGVETCTSLEEVLADESIRLVSLCTPDHTHACLGARVLKAGRHLLLEKPLAISLHGARHLGRALDDSGSQSLFSVGYEFRLNPAVLQVRELVRSGFTGEVEAFSLHHFRRPFKRDKWQRWIQHRRFSGGLIVEETCHWFDLLRFLTGKEVEGVQCRIADRIHADFDYEDVAYIQGRLSGSGVFQIAHALTGFDFSLVVAVHGRRGTVWCQLKEQPSSRLDGGASDYCALVAWGAPDRPPTEASVRTFGPEATEPRNIRDCVRHFAECAARGTEPAVGYLDGLRSLELSLLARAAAQQDRELGPGDLPALEAAEATVGQDDRPAEGID